MNDLFVIFGMLVFMFIIAIILIALGEYENRRREYYKKYYIEHPDEKEKIEQEKRRIIEEIEQEEQRINKTLLKSEVSYEKIREKKEKYILKSSRFAPVLIAFIYLIKIAIYFHYSTKNPWIYILCFSPFILTCILIVCIEEKWTRHLMAKFILIYDVVLMQNKPFNVEDFPSTFIVSEKKIFYISRACKKYKEILVKDFDRFYRGLISLAKLKNVKIINDDEDEIHIFLTYKELDRLMESCEAVFDLNKEDEHEGWSKSVITVAEEDKRAIWLNSGEDRLHENMTSFICGYSVNNAYSWDPLLQLGYNPGFFYTDNKLIYYVYIVIKWIIGLFAIALIYPLIYLIFDWLSTFNIIVILLMVVIFLLIILICQLKKLLKNKY